jgi:hypothetical protein
MVRISPTASSVASCLCGHGWDGSNLSFFLALSEVQVLLGVSFDVGAAPFEGVADCMMPTTTNIAPIAQGLRKSLLPVACLSDFNLPLIGVLHSAWVVLDI